MGIQKLHSDLLKMFKYLGKTTENAVKQKVLIIGVQNCISFVKDENLVIIWLKR